MKLKRFLLRYEPRGIGLEVEDDGGKVEVRHKSLLDKQVISEMDILALAEELCASEPELLNARKHRGTLLQLLSRLYRIEAFGGPPSRVDEAMETPTKPEEYCASSVSACKSRKDEERSTSSDVDPYFEDVGRLVVLVGLRGKLQAYNGELAFVMKANERKDKYEVDVSSSSADQRETIKIKGIKHLLSVLAVARPLAIGTCVVLNNLHSHAELNGSIGTVVECCDQGKRYEVRSAGGQLFRVKSEHAVPVEASALGKENLVPNMAVDSPPPDFCRSFSRPTLTLRSSSPSDGSGELLEPGSIIELVGLKNHPEYNGQEAKIVAVDRESCRYEVRIVEDGCYKQIKRENVRLVAFPPSASLVNSTKDHRYGSMMSIARNASQMLKVGYGPKH